MNRETFFRGFTRQVSQTGSTGVHNLRPLFSFAVAICKLFVSDNLLLQQIK